MPKSKPPRKKYSRPNPARAINQNIQRHQHCQSEVRHILDHAQASEVWCLDHNTHICYLTRQSAEQLEKVLNSSATLSSL